eukprot:7332214-Heterocapsa_arctica.AAC.2
MANSGELQNRWAGGQSGIHHVQGPGKQDVQAGVGQVFAHNGHLGTGKDRRPCPVHYGNGFLVPDAQMRRDGRDHGASRAPGEHSANGRHGKRYEAGRYRERQHHGDGDEGGHQRNREKYRKAHGFGQQEDPGRRGHREYQEDHAHHDSKGKKAGQAIPT